MYLSQNVEINPTKTIQYNNFKLRWSFDGNSSVISLFTHGESFLSTDHWISENSDLLSFDNDNELLSLDFLVPNYNDDIQISLNNILFGKVEIKNPEYIIPPTNHRCFDPIEKRLTCFYAVKKNTNHSILKLHDNFSLIISDNYYAGFILDNPIIFLTDDKEGEIDTNDIPNNDEYNIMAEFMKIMSDNYLYDLEDDISILVKELYENITPKITLIKSELRRNILKKVLDDLLDFYE